MRMRVEFMRLQKILIIAIFVLILTVGAVSASDNNQTSDSLTVNDDDEIETLDEDAADYGGDVSLSMDDKDEKLAVQDQHPFRFQICSPEITQSKPHIPEMVNTRPLPSTAI